MFKRFFAFFAAKQPLDGTPTAAPSPSGPQGGPAAPRPASGPQSPSGPTSTPPSGSGPSLRSPPQSPPQQPAPPTSPPAPQVTPGTPSVPNVTVGTEATTPTTTVGGAAVNTATGEVDRAQLEPNGKSVDLEASLSGIVRDANDCLDLVVINRDFNPFRIEPKLKDGRPLEGDYQRPGEIYRARAFIPIKGLFAQVGTQIGLDPALANGLAEALSDAVVLRTPAHQFRTAAGAGNRVVFYGGAVGHGHIDRLVEAIGRQHMRLLKVMTHFNAGAAGEEGGSQGGAPAAIVAERVGGTTHVGGFSSGFRDGKPVSIKSDWPSDYGQLSDGSGEHYNAHLLAVDYRGGVKDTIPDATLAAYKRNADMWDCAAGMSVPFAGGDPDPRFTHYQFNPLEVYDQASAVTVANSLAEIDEHAFLRRHGAFYCAEGQYCIANLGPQKKTLLKRARFGDTPFGKCIDNFGAAPGYQGMSPEQRRQRPEIGWQHLAGLGSGNGGISAEQFQHLANTDRTAAGLEWIGDDIEGWQAFKPREENELIARPMTVATMAWSLFRRYLPRAGIARVIVADLVRAYVTGSDAAKRAVLALSGGADPTTPQGQMALAPAGMRIATGLLFGIIRNEEMRDGLLKQSGYEDIPPDKHRKLVQTAYDSFIAVLTNADYASQEDFDNALRAADKMFSGIKVERTYINMLTKSYDRRSGAPMLYAAPACFVLWAQYPWYAGTDCIRYVATAMHVSQRRPDAAAAA